MVGAAHCALRVLCLLALTIAFARAAQAQQEVDAPFGSEGRYRFGPLRFTPTLLVGDIGIDRNVFNEEVDPKSDFTTVVGPGVTWWLPAGRARIVGKNAGQYLYFKTYESQRGWNGMNTLRSDFVLGRFTPFVSGTYNNTRNRSGFEIDARSRATISQALIGTEVRLSPKTTLVVSEARERTLFDREETFRGASLAEQLNRRTSSERVALRYALTPLTTFVVNAETTRDRFDTTAVRDSNSVRVMPGFELKPFALISGSVFVGFREFDALDASVPDYRGTVAAVTANYVLRALRFSGTVNRDIFYSYDLAEPYYMLTDMGLGVTWRLGPTWDVRVKGNRQSLGYRRSGVATVVSGRTDHARQYTAGVGYLVGSTARIGVDAMHLTRDAAITARTYEGFRIGASVSYGATQGTP